MENIDVKKLVEDIKEAEAAKKNGTWIEWGTKKGIGYPWKYNEKIWCGTSYEDYVTGLYTLRAFLRGRMHRKNPPEPLRGMHRSMIENGSRAPDSEIMWDMHAHNEKIAQKVAESYQREEAAA